MSVTFQTKQLGKYRLDADNKGNKYTLTHSVAPNDLVNYKYAYGTTIVAGGNFVSDIPEDGCIIIQQTITNIGDEGYIVKTVAVDKNYYNQPINIRLNTDNDYDINYSTAKVKCIPSFWQLRVADETDASNNVLTYLAEVCKKGEWLQTQSSSTDIGVCDFKACPLGSSSSEPFTDESNPSDFPWAGDGGLLMADLPTVVLTVKYTATKSPHLYGEFKGVNPAGFSGTPSQLKPQGTAEGMWRAVHQSIASYKVNNVTKYQVTRTMEKAPFATSQTYWLKSKNGGTWTW